jgi:anti-anti-sigma regulatory factor
MPTAEAAPTTDGAVSTCEKCDVFTCVCVRVCAAATVLIMHLHGMIFFGSANSVVEEVKGHLATLAELQLPLRFLLLDFDRCSAIDSSAVGVLFQTRRQIKEAGLIFACASTEILSMLNKQGQHEFTHFTTLDLALEHCENKLLARYGHDIPESSSPPSPIMHKTSLPFGVKAARDGLLLRDPNNVREATSMSQLSAIDECKPTDNSQHSPSTDDEGNLDLPSAALPTDQAEVRRQRRRMLRDGRGSTAASPSRRTKERLPNPFMQPERASTSSEPHTRGHRRVSGEAVDPKLPASYTETVAARASGLSESREQRNSSDDSSDSSTGGGLATIYSPEQARLELRPEALAKMRDRFTEAMRASYGARELEALFEHCDIMLVPPNFTVVSSAVPTHPSSDGTQPPYLYVLDRGNVSSYATLGGEGLGNEEVGAPDSIGADLNAGLSRSTGDTNLRHRLAKYGAGAILGVASFVTPVDMPDLNILPTAAISDTYCQLLRLPRSRCDELESIAPKLVFRLYRLLVLISERRLQDHRSAATPRVTARAPRMCGTHTHTHAYACVVVARHPRTLRAFARMPHDPSRRHVAPLTACARALGRVCAACVSSPPKPSRSTCARRPTFSACSPAATRSPRPPSNCSSSRRRAAPQRTPASPTSGCLLRARRRRRPAIRGTRRMARTWVAGQ